MSAPVPPSSSRLVRVLVPVALVVIAASVLGLFLLGGAPAAGVGDCVAPGADRGIVVVGCDDEAAAYEVIGVLDDVRSAQSQPACTAAFPRTTASYFDGEATTLPGRVLCLVTA